MRGRTIPDNTLPTPIHTYTYIFLIFKIMKKKKNRIHILLLFFRFVSLLINNSKILMNNQNKKNITNKKRRKDILMGKGERERESKDTYEPDYNW
jgi:hypothetical protein